MKVIKSLDFASQKKRIEKTVVDPYQVHAEDYENINDLVRRSVRCKERIKPDTNPLAEYDEDLLTDATDEFNKLFEDQASLQPSDEAAQQSEAAEVTNGSNTSEPQIP